jgi:cobalt-zinc-cadmium efflux system outer membrane protein
MVSMEWPLDLFRRRGRTEVAEREVTAAEQAIADRERRLAGDVRARYGAVLVAVRELTTLDELVAAATRQRDLLRGRVDEGASPPLERNLVEVELHRLAAERLLQAGRTEAALIELKRVMGVEPATPLALRETLDALVRRESAVPVAIVEQRPDVREAATRVRVAEARVDRAQREGRFDLAAYGAYMRMDSGFPQFGTNAAGSPERIGDVFHYVAGGVRITLPLRNRNQGEVAAARAAREAAETHADALRLNAAAEIASARAQDEQAHAAVALYGNAAGALGLARQNFDVITESYQLGRSTIFDVLTEQRRYLDLERGYVDALRAAFEARTALLLASGGMR